MKNTKFLIPILIYILFKMYSLNHAEVKKLPEKKNSILNIIKKENNGSVFIDDIDKEKKYISFFDQYKKYKPGDLISVLIDENTIANNRTADRMKRYASSLLEDQEKKPEPNKIARFIKKFFKLNQQSENNLLGSGQNFSENFLAGTITVTVKKILQNKNLVVSGEKNIIINQGNELIKLSGIIDPNDVNSENKIFSTNIANVKIECLRNDYIKDVQKIGWWQRFILHVIPI
ncbi:flagellar basal body L-ring protein FlgH [Buchnera aphidicola (Chaitoregma tattakana)]|uniref:flagellar basal body L-ring protein FlgH n=1 Tax=Buchnera aphidicola TaxID=9 RepID=UPI0031B84DBD